MLLLTSRIGTRERIFELTEVIHPKAVPGSLRVATEEDYETILHWNLAFRDEALPDKNMSDIERTTRLNIQNGEFFVWEASFDHIVSMAKKSRPVVHVISIGMVYTPSEERGKGYASNCVASLSQHLLDSGWQACSLFTDLANPTSNSIYQKMGYRPLIDFNDYIFE